MVLSGAARTVGCASEGGGGYYKVFVMSDWLRLNVGGVPFETTRATLASCPGGPLARMFASHSSFAVAAMEDGVYRLDTCPRAFPVILNWLRYKRLTLGGVCPMDVLPVADYFGIEDLCDALIVRVEEVCS